MKKATAWIRILVLAVFLAPAALHAATGPKILRIRALGEPTTLDWTRANTWAESLVVRNIMEGLVGVDKKLKIVPDLAKKWNVSGDGKTYTFFIKPGVKWSDGVPLKAQHFVDAWRRLIEKKTDSNYAYLLFDVLGAEDFSNGKITDFDQVGIKAKDDLTLEVKLRAPMPSWIWIPSMWNTFPVRKDLIEKFGELWDRPGNIVTLGPFIPSSYQPGRAIVLSRNPSYHGSHGNVDQILMALVHDDTTALKLYEVGQLDFVPKISAQPASKLVGRPDFHTSPELRTIHIKMNTEKGPLTDVRVRRAVAMAIDRKKLTGVMQGKPAIASSFVPPQIEGYSAGAGMKFDRAKAKALLKEAGFDEANPLKLNMISPAFDDEIALAGFIKDELKANLGAEVQVEVMEPKRYYSPVLNLPDYSMLIAFWVADYPDADNFYASFMSSSGNNRFHWKDEKFDHIVLKARGIFDRKKREPNYFEADRVLVQDQVAAIPMYYGRITYLIRPAVKGFSFIPLNFYLFKDVVLND